jgi:hypothetical protein
MKHEFSRDIIEYSPNISTKIVRYAGTSKDSDGHYESNFTVVVRYYRFAARLEMYCEVSGFLTDIGADIILLSHRATQFHIRYID